MHHWIDVDVELPSSWCLCLVVGGVEEDVQMMLGPLQMMHEAGLLGSYCY